MKRFTVLLSTAFLFLVFSPDAFAQTKTRVRFARGAASATVRGTVKGYVYRDYVFSARAGQRVTITLAAKYPHPDMVVRNPGGENLSSGGADWNGALETTGNYTVRVLLPRAFARRGTAAAYKLTIEIE
jgi:hypothetical protein